MNLVKFLVMWWWKGENAQEVTERFSKWTPPEYIKFLYPISTIIGANRAFCVGEVEKEEDLARAVLGWTDICTYEFYPIMDSAEIIKL